MCVDSGSVSWCFWGLEHIFMSTVKPETEGRHTCSTARVLPTQHPLMTSFTEAQFTPCLSTLTFPQGQVPLLPSTTKGSSLKVPLRASDWALWTQFQRGHENQNQSVSPSGTQTNRNSMLCRGGYEEVVGRQLQGTGMHCPRLLLCVIYRTDAVCSTLSSCACREAS